MKLTVLVVLVAAAVQGCGDLSVFALDKSDAFARVETGFGTPAPRARVVELMGAPVKQTYHDLFGISHERLTFKDSRRTYTVTLINGVAVSKSVEVKPH